MNTRKRGRLRALASVNRFLKHWTPKNVLMLDPPGIHFQHEDKRIVIHLRPDADYQTLNLEFVLRGKAFTFNARTCHDGDSVYVSDMHLYCDDRREVWK